jgi:spermidine synthase/MFS family permease
MNIQVQRLVRPSVNWLALLFLLSGFAALIYQIVWQRVLFTAFGVNIESVTIIVSVFMFGLGIGSLVGGALSKRFPRRLPQLFLLCELAIGLFGLFSLPLMKAVSQLTLHSSLLTLALTAYALLSLPTIFMGATLPILVAQLHRQDRNVGRIVASLYFLNTAGSALACFLTVNVLFVIGGLQTAVLCACLCNILVGVLVYGYVTRTARQESADEPKPESVSHSPAAGDEDAGRRGRFLLVLLLSAAVGYIALSQEILWFRLVGYMTGGRPDVFGQVLGFLLVGIAFGAITLSRLYLRDGTSVLAFIAAMLTASGVLYYVSIPLIGQVATQSGTLGLWFAYGAVALVAFLAGSIFPALCHYGIASGSAVGPRVSWVYFANIIGSTAGPLLTGFVLMQHYTLQQLVLYLSLASLVLAGIVWLAAPLPSKGRAAAFGGIVLGMAVMLAVHEQAYELILERLHYKTEYAQKGPYKYVLQNRNGIIAVEPGISDTVYGGGMYDGTFNIDPVLNTNSIDRAYMFAALHPQAEDVLEIGLSSGSWARVLASHSGVKQLTIVEINPAYRQLLQHYPETAALLEDPKVVIHYDDGRRWLNRNPDRKFEFILMNTTFHWRDQCTNLLSEEFLRLCKAHLKEGGVMYYNTTWSPDVPYTAARVFAHVTRYGSFVAASDRPFPGSAEEKRRNLLQFRCAGRPVLVESDPALRKVLDKLAASDTSDQAEELRGRPGLWHITDDNMAPEFKRPLR